MTFYDHLLAPTADRPGLSPKTVYGIHLRIRGALTEAVRRGLVTGNVALVARSPRLKAIPTTEGRSWTDEQLRQFLRASAGHRFFPILWLSATTGMGRNEVLGLKWPDIDLDKHRLCVNRGLVSVGYEVHQTRGKTNTSRRTIDLDDTTVAVLSNWRAFQRSRSRRGRDRPRRGMGLHRRRRKPDPPPRAVPSVRADRPQCPVFR